MTTLTITPRDAAHALASLWKTGAQAPEAEAMWAKVVAYFTAEPAAVSVEVDASIWSPIIAATGDAIAQAMGR